jgi:hypothetical protein
MAPKVTGLVLVARNLSSRRLQPRLTQLKRNHQWS